MPTVTTVASNSVPFTDLQTVFGRRGAAAGCQCQRYKLNPREHFAGFPVAERVDRLRAQAEDPSGLVAYLDDEPVGWCAVEPRPAYHGMVRNQRVPWLDRTEDRADETVWAVTCFVTRAGFRKRGVAGELARATVPHARSGGARAVEGYPILTKKVLLTELHVGTAGMFEAAGFVEVARPTLRRAVYRVDL
ncbi:GNAT family N-acetyltransferase [Asanoa iriomotensis]|uniref:N-acetyltransferase domain-containing protein n=1 Tax=Asanoa iriomotensis TaxID=234613 RepID=A0ABQ4CFZ6_9ACTN|nr:GNAT family N-acetyltransferase [Asanoa iriomotensis]GIF61707.1 hypothetical protein Air01nite_78020 [Asanoa iriomotensis]